MITGTLKAMVLSIKSNDRNGSRVCWMVAEEEIPGPRYGICVMR